MKAEELLKLYSDGIRNFIGADLGCVNLRGADLRYVNLRGANLGYACLRGADLRYANLGNACLRGADLRYANLEGANLRNTILDKLNIIPHPTKEEVLQAEFEIEGDFIVGNRTAISRYIGLTIYVPGHIYTAPIFSVGRTSSCHPGLYFAPKHWFEHHSAYSSFSLVKCAAILKETVHAGDKWRAKRLLILPEVS